MITEYFSGNERFQAPYVFRMVHPVRNNNGKLAGDPGNAHVDLKVVNGPFDNRAYLVEAVPFFRIPLDTGLFWRWNRVFRSRISTVRLPYEPWDSPI